MNLKASFIIIIILIKSYIIAQKATISGYIQNSNGEALIGAVIYDQKSQKGTLSNNFGFYSLKLNKADSLYLLVSYIGYKTINKHIFLTDNLRINFTLQSATNIKAIDIIAEKYRDKNIDFLQIPAKQMSAIPSLTGEIDIMKSYQLMPGISSGSEGSNAIYVRGGSPDQNLFLLDDVPLYDVNHLGGFISVFDYSAIKDVTLIKGAFPAKYSGRLSSVIDIRMKEGNMKEYHGEISLSPLISKLFFEGPIIKNKSSFMLSARRSYIDLFTNTYTYIKYGKGNKAAYRFYDINIKVNQKIKAKDRLFLSFYSGNDKIFGDLQIKENEPEIYNSLKARTQWGNNLLSFRWNHIYNTNLFSNTTLSYTNYNYNTFIDDHLQQILTLEDTTADQTENPENRFYTDTTTARFGNKYELSIFDYTLKTDFNWYLNPKTEINWGGAYIQHAYQPGVSSSYVQIDTTGNSFSFTDLTTMANEIYFYLSASIQIKNLIFLNTGIHYSIYQVDNKTFFYPQPRFSIKVKLSNKFKFSAAYSQMVQYLHLLPSTDLSRPTDFWVPANSKAPPEKATQYSLGISYQSANHHYELSVETYYKRMDNLVEMKRNQTFFGSTGSWIDKIETEGIGTSKGVEFLVKKNHGKINGWIAYTLSNTQRRFENTDINSGSWFPFKYDRRHDISIFLNYELNENVNLSVTWIYMTGNAITLAGQKFPALNTYRFEFDPNSFNVNNDYIPVWQFKDAFIYDGKNNYRMPSYHRLDFAVKFIKEKKRGLRTWSINIYNLYNRKNPYFLFYKKINGTNKMQLYKFSLFPIIPSIAYNFKF